MDVLVRYSSSRFADPNPWPDRYTVSPFEEAIACSQRWKRFGREFPWRDSVRKPVRRRLSGGTNCSIDRASIERVSFYAMVRWVRI
jgi:hypothetical protein